MSKELITPVEMSEEEFLEFTKSMNKKGHLYRCGKCGYEKDLYNSDYCPQCSKDFMYYTLPKLMDEHIPIMQKVEKDVSETTEDKT